MIDFYSKKAMFLTVLSLLFSIWTSAQTGQYLHFDGDDDYVRLDTASIYVDGSTEVSMTGWFYTDDLIYGAGMMGFRGSGTGDAMYLIQLSNGIVESRLSNSAGLHEVVAPAGSIVADQWQHVAWIFDGSTVELYIDGVSIGSSSASGSFNSDDKAFGIGKNILAGYNFIFKGRIDEVTLWSKALSQTEIDDMIADELVGDELGLELYYKFNQGIPDSDNTSISDLICETGTGERNASLENFALTGTSSNFGGVLDESTQAISFPIIANKLITDAPFDLEAYSSSGLPISYTIMSGPASVSAAEVTLDGVVGEVVVAASQEGNMEIDPADTVFSSFNVLDPAITTPTVMLTNPTEGDVFVPELGPIQLAAKASIPYPDLFSVADVSVTIDGNVILLTDYENGHYTGWWTPPSYGEFTVEVTGNNNFGSSNTETYTINVINTASSQVVAAATDVWIYSDVYSQEVEVTLPSYMGAYDQILGTLNIDCPAGGCDPWDRVSHVEVKGHDGNWYEIIRYLTPYGVACSHDIDLTDFMSLLQGTITLRFTLGTSGNGFLYSLDLDYQAGAPTYNYSNITELWNNTYAFGDLANLQPCEIYNVDYAEDVLAGKIKLVSSGHGWGDNNTGNAAEFHHDIHNIWVNGDETFEQDNWVDCNPNPDGCDPQNGTWFYDRAGWCPGSIAQWFDYDIAAGSFDSPMELKYIFDEDYVDYCHPNNPDCISGTTCINCDDGFNPHLIVSTHLISFGDVPLDNNQTALDINEESVLNNPLQFDVYPNPSYGEFKLSFNEVIRNSTIHIYSLQGELLREIRCESGKQEYDINFSNMPAGVYVVKLINEKQTSSRKIIVY